MPYVKQYRRANLDSIIEYMERMGIVADGDLNYILFKFAKRNCNSYNKYKNFIGELTETTVEIRRKLLAPYEDKKETENGIIEERLLCQKKEK